MAVPLERDHPSVPRPLVGEEKARFCATCGERLFITSLGFWAHPHTFVAPVVGPEGRDGGMSFCKACAIFRGSAIHQV
jgi:hypothetical protein